MSASKKLVTAKSTRATNMELALNKINDDPELQPRKSMDLDTLREYSNAWLEGAKFPPIAVFFDGETYWLADGFYRVRSARKANLTSIKAVVYDGDRRDAKLFSVGANAEHGLRRTNEDKKNAVLKLLDDAEWCLWADAEIARACRVSSPTVTRYREASPGLKGHGVTVRISGDGSVRNNARPDPVATAGVPEATFVRPPTMMSKQEVSDKFTRAITRHIRKRDPEARTGVDYEHGQCEIVAKDGIYCFGTCDSNKSLYLTLGRVLIARACLKPKGRATIIGHFPRSLAPLIKTLAEKLAVDCQTPEQVLAT